MTNVFNVAYVFIELAAEYAQINQGDRMTLLRLQNMLFFAQGYALAQYDRKLFADTIEAWTCGPVVPAITHHYSNDQNQVLPLEAFDDRCITDDEISLLLDVWRACEDFSTGKLVEITHGSGTPWHVIYDAESINAIPTELIRAYFTSHPFAKPLTHKDTIPLFVPERTADGIPIIPRDIAEGWDR